MFLLQLCQRDWYCPTVFLLCWISSVGAPVLLSIYPLHICECVFGILLHLSYFPEEMMGYNLETQSASLSVSLCAVVFLYLCRIRQGIFYSGCDVIVFGDRGKELSQKERGKHKQGGTWIHPRGAFGADEDLEREGGNWICLAWLPLLCYKSTMQGVRFSQHGFEVISVGPQT